MGRIVLTMQMTLNGVVSNVEQWMRLSDEMLQDMYTYYDTVDAVVMGGHTYASMAAYWLEAERSSSSELERRIAKKLNDTRKLVIAHGDLDLVWRHTELVRVEDSNSLPRAMEHWSHTIHGNISVESGVRTWQRFIQNGLFDDLWLLVHPVVVAQGDQLFAGGTATFPLVLRHTKRYQNGVVSLYYQRESNQ